jgi:hypothetical protein
VAFGGLVVAFRQAGRHAGRFRGSIRTVLRDLERLKSRR